MKRLLTNRLFRNGLPMQRRTLALVAVLVLLSAAFVWVVLRAGPMAPVEVTVYTVESRAISPALFGIGTVQARYTYKVGPTAPGRVRAVHVHAGETVKAGQLLAEIDPSDLDDRIQAQGSAMKRAQAQLSEAQARLDYASTQERRYSALLADQLVSQEMAAGKRQELAVAQAAVSAAREELHRIGSEHRALSTVGEDLRLVSPVAGVVSLRNAEPGSTVVAGQSVVEVIDPDSLWINTRFDQVRAAGLQPGLKASVTLRSREGAALPGKVVLVEPLADAVTEELMAKITLDQPPHPLPPVGELAEVHVALPELPARPVVPNASLHRVGEGTGVWRLIDGEPHLAPIRTGASDLDGNVQVLEGLSVGDEIVVYSERVLSARSRVKPVSGQPGARR